MQTRLIPELLASDTGQQADRILRKCVHCGFCNATCPTYQLTGDELDGPRGRIYQIKQVLEGDTAADSTLLHLDRCLTCRNCETTCPSGVEYASLIDIGRQIVEQQVSRPWHQRLRRTMLRHFLLSPLFSISLHSARLLRPLLPASLRMHIPAKNTVPVNTTQQSHDDKVLLIQGCVQTALQPSIDAAARSVFDQCGISVYEHRATCCGAISHHLSAEEAALQQIRTNIDQWLAIMQQQGIDKITMTASGCGMMIRDYARLLAHDPDYADKAKQLCTAYRDPVELLEQADRPPSGNTSAKRIAFHPPCTLQHGQQLAGRVEALLKRQGYELQHFDERHLCCGSAGTYSILQSDLANSLRQRKLEHIEAAAPEMIVTANIGCQQHLQAGSDVPVRHWLELLA